MAYSQEQIARITEGVCNTCKDMGVQECTWAQREIEKLLEGNPAATKEDIIDTAYQTLKPNMVSNVPQRMMFTSYADPNVLRVELMSNLSKLIDEIDDENVTP